MTAAAAAGERLAEACGGTSAEEFGQVTVDVPAERWVESLSRARDEAGCAFFDWLSAVDNTTGGDEDDPHFAVLAHVWNVEARLGLLVRTRAAADEPRLPTITGVYRGAVWHERETAEMFGIVFDGHPGLTPLLLPDGFEGHPLRKDFVLAARVAKLWPGEKEPGEGGTPGGGERAAPRRRRRVKPPGVPDDWGPARD